MILLRFTLPGAYPDFYNMLPKTRSEAIAAGFRFFNTGRPCRNGHTADRYTSTGNCTACLVASRNGQQSQFQQARAGQFTGTTPFVFQLHPGDHAAALAYCQALALQRSQAPAAPMVLPDWLAQARRQLPPEVVAQHEALPRLPSDER